jgi:hypothetical protein
MCARQFSSGAVRLCGPKDRLVRPLLLSSMQRSRGANLLLWPLSDRLRLARERSTEKREMPSTWVPWVERSWSRVSPVHDKQQ